MANTDPRSLPELISAVTGDLANLMRKESELIRSEGAIDPDTAAGYILQEEGFLEKA